MTEAEFQRQVIDLAHLHGWLVHHTRPAQMGSGRWATPVQGDTGFPDLVLAHPKRGVLFLELKSARGRLQPNQVAWLHALSMGGAHVYTFKPESLADIVELLRGNHQNPTT